MDACDFDKVLKISKIKPNDYENFKYNFEKVLKMIDQILEINIEENIPYEKYWISLRTREDKEDIKPFLILL